MLPLKMKEYTKDIKEQIMAHSEFSVKDQIYGIQYQMNLKALIHLIASRKRKSNIS